MPSYQAELLGSDGSWGNTEGPAIDSQNRLYFTSRGTYKGIVRWTEGQGFERWADVATKEGPGGLWFDEEDNLFVTATGEQQILKVAPDKTVTVVASNFDLMPNVSKGPNDLVVLPNGVILFTEPNGYDGKAPNGTIYRVDREGKVHLFSQEITGPNGIITSSDKRTLFVSNNVAENTSMISRWPIDEEGRPGNLQRIAVVEPCQADGMDVNAEGNLWLTCYSHGTAYLISPEGKQLEKVTSGQKALTNAKFGRGAMRNWLYLTSSDMARVTGYVYRVKLPVGGIR
ncbi:MAG: SMP-30/gluconolactonase/LRE family protein [Bryobacter sp.]|nr:SMP-30/gluconolactonase/LRE family protein [Bryobacter sp.]